MTEYPEKYLEGIRLFNAEDFFECHDVLEELWSETLGEEKKFYQGLIQASVALFHFGNENQELLEAENTYPTGVELRDERVPKIPLVNGQSDL
jgi:predicted metal-dependent hydrolase